MPREPKRKNLKPPGECIFCGGGAVPGNPMTKEHIFADWIAKLLGPTKERHIQAKHRGQFFDEMDERFRRRWEGDPLTRTFKVVCKNCNSGWMSTIEKAAQPIMTPLILGQKYELTPEGKKIIARWATLKTIVFETDDPEYQSVKPEVVAAFYRNKEPFPDWRVWIGQTLSERWRSGCLRVAVSIREEGSQPPPVKSRFKDMQTTTFGIGQLWMQVMSDNVGALFAHDYRAAFLLRQIWPETQGTLRWPLALLMSDTDGEAIARILQLMMERR